MNYKIFILSIIYSLFFISVFATDWGPMNSRTIYCLLDVRWCFGKEIEYSGTIHPLPTIGYSDLDQIGYAGTIIGSITASSAEDVKDVRDFGALGDGKTDDTFAIQAALDYFKTTGGKITISVPGTYIISSSLIIYSNETLEGSSGVVLARQPLASPNQAYTRCPNVIANYSATIENNTDDEALYDHDIVIRNITIRDTLDSSLGGGKQRAPHVWARGLIELNNITNALVENYSSETINEEFFYGIDLQSATYSTIRNAKIINKNDGIHCTGGTHDIVIDTFDLDISHGDNISLNADDYPADTGRAKDIYNIAIRNGIVRSPVGGIPLILTGSWAPWARGNRYRQGNVCVIDGKLYKVYNDITAVESITAPNHLPGAPGTAEGIRSTCKTYDSGVNAITWTFVGPGSNTEANVYNIAMDNVIATRSPSGVCTVIGNCMAAGYNYGVYIDEANGINTSRNSYVNNVNISNCAKWNGSTWGPLPVRRQYYNGPEYGGLNTQTLIIIDFNIIIDSDADDIPDDNDNCPTIPNGPQLATCMQGSDREGSPCYSDADCAHGCSSNGKCSSTQEDTDGDGIGDVCDNCPTVYNPDQTDTNGNGIGDVCDETPTLINLSTFTATVNAGKVIIQWSTESENDNADFK